MTDEYRDVLHKQIKDTLTAALAKQAARIRELEATIADLSAANQAGSAYVDTLRMSVRRLDWYLAHAQDFICWKDSWEWKGDPDGDTGRTWEEAVDMARAAIAAEGGDDE